MKPGLAVLAFCIAVLLKLSLGCGPRADAQKVLDGVKAFSREMPPALEVAYTAALKLCAGEESCVRKTVEIWDPVWAGLELLDDACDAVPSLCEEPSR